MIKILSTALVVSMVMLFVQVYFNSKANDELNMARYQADRLEFRVDSIKGEMFILETEVDRYRIALEILEEEDSRAASEFNKRLSLTE